MFAVRPAGGSQWRWFWATVPFAFRATIEAQPRDARVTSVAQGALALCCEPCRSTEICRLANY
jgi:hypothetical protein